MTDIRSDVHRLNGIWNNQGPVFPGDKISGENVMATIRTAVATVMRHQIRRCLIVSFFIEAILVTEFKIRQLFDLS